MPTATQPITPQLVAELVDTLNRLRDARADGDPCHDTKFCEGCQICVLDRRFRRLLDKLPRQETP